MLFSFPNSYVDDCGRESVHKRSWTVVTNISDIAHVPNTIVMHIAEVLRT